MNFKEGGVFYGESEGEPGIAGEWKLDGEEVVITVDFLGVKMVWRGKIQGDTITLEDGSTWVKQKP